ncbi:MAG TPA: hypothetical protein VH678_08525 [Xanthobacteraceae bacterium]|jgi:hypothetical protein
MRVGGAIAASGRRRRTTLHVIVPQHSVLVTVSPKSASSHYSHLFARISEEDDGYAIEVRLHDEAKPQSAAWGEETADSLEAASLMVARLASEFSIPQERIKIEIRTNDMTNGTQH